MKKNNSFNLKLFLSIRRYLALSIASAVIGAIFLLFLAYPRIDSLNNLSKKIKNEQQVLEKYQTKIKDTEQIALLKEFQNKEAIDQVLPSYKPLLELLNSLNNLAISNQTILEKLDLSPGKIASQGAEITEEKASNKTGYAGMEISFTARGQLENLDNFLNSIEQMSPITSVKSISLQRKEQESNGETIIFASADLVLTTHYYTQSVKTTIESPLPKIGSKELEIFNVILSFQQSDLEKQTEIKDGGNEDVFGIDNWEQIQEDAKKETQKTSGEIQI